MDDKALEKLIGMAFEIERLDDPGAPETVGPACLSMSRAIMAAEGRIGLAVHERRHVRSCPTCAPRLRVLGGRTHAAIRRARTRWLIGGAASVAACLSWMWLSWWRQDDTPDTPTAYIDPAAPLDVGRDTRPDVLHPELPALAVGVNYSPGDKQRNHARIDCFEPSVEEHSVMLAVFRSWDSACQCLVWRLHRWEDGTTLATMDANESMDIQVDVTDDPPVQQLLLLAVSRRAEDLPEDNEEASALLACLNDAVPPSGPLDDAFVCASAVESCLPAGVSVMPQTFVVAR